MMSSVELWEDNAGQLSLIHRDVDGVMVQGYGGLQHVGDWLFREDAAALVRWDTAGWTAPPLGADALADPDHQLGVHVATWRPFGGGGDHVVWHRQPGSAAAHYVGEEDEEA